MCGRETVRIDGTVQSDGTAGTTREEREGDATGGRPPQFRTDLVSELLEENEELHRQLDRFQPGPESDNDYYGIGKAEKPSQTEHSEHVKQIIDKSKADSFKVDYPEHIIPAGTFNPDAELKKTLDGIKEQKAQESEKYGLPHGFSVMDGYLSGPPQVTTEWRRIQGLSDAQKAHLEASSGHGNDYIDTDVTDQSDNVANEILEQAMGGDLKKKIESPQDRMGRYGKRATQFDGRNPGTVSQDEANKREAQMFKELMNSDTIDPKAFHEFQRLTKLHKQELSDLNGDLLDPKQIENVDKAETMKHLAQAVANVGFKAKDVETKRSMGALGVTATHGEVLAETMGRLVNNKNHFNKRIEHINSVYDKAKAKLSRVNQLFDSLSRRAGKLMSAHEPHEAKRVFSMSIDAAQMRHQLKAYMKRNQLSKKKAIEGLLQVDSLIGREENNTAAVMTVIMDQANHIKKQVNQLTTLGDIRMDGESGSVLTYQPLDVPTQVLLETNSSHDDPVPLDFDPNDDLMMLLETGDNQDESDDIDGDSPDGPAHPSALFEISADVNPSSELPEKDDPSLPSLFEISEELMNAA